MKILRLRFTNLNSLHGDWSIDFTTAPLVDAGLFAITGSTGAGKTTLLDAITLALYGRAARYGTDPNPEEMMSRHTGACSSEVEFSCASGTYRSVWQLRRARNKPTGAIQGAERKVIALPSEAVLTQKIDDSNRKIEELTSLNCERFLRSVMLAQGDFAAFLKAKPKERTELLEQITGTHIYSEISIAAYRYSETARLAHEQLFLQHANVQVLAPEARTERETQLVATGGRLNEIKGELAKLDTRISDARGFLACADEGGKIEVAAAAIVQERQSCSADLSALALHEKAAPFSGRLAELDLLSKQTREDEAKLAELRLALPKLGETLQTRKAEAEAARGSLATVEQEEEKLKPLWAEVTKLDGQVAIARNALGRRTETRLQAEEAQQKLQNDLESKQKTLAKHQASFAELSSWLQTNADHGRIASVLPELQVACTRWTDHSAQWGEIRKEVAALERSILEDEKTLAAAEGTIAKLKGDWESKEEKFAQERDAFEKLAEKRPLVDWEKEREAAQTRVFGLTELQVLAGEVVAEATRHATLQKTSKTLVEKGEALAAELATKREHLQAAIELTAAQQKNVDMVQLVQTLEQQRHALVEGKPCPLCGSTEHPYAAPENLPSAELKVAAAALQKAEKQQDKVRKELAELEKQEAANATEKKRAAADLDESADLSAHREKQWKAKVTPLGVTLTSNQAQEVTELLGGETQRLAALKDRVDKLRSCETKLRESERVSETAKTLYKEKTAERDKLDGLLKQNRKSLTSAATRAKTSETSVTESRAAFSEQVESFSLVVSDLASAEAALKQLKERSGAFVAKTSARTTSEGEIKVCESAIQEVQKQIESAAEKLKALKQLEESDGKALQTLESTRRAKFEDRDVAADQERVAASLKVCRQSVANSVEVCNKAVQDEATCKTEIDALAKATSERGTKLSQGTSELERDSGESGFESVQLLRQALLDQSRAQGLGELRKRLDNSEQALAGRRSANDAAKAKLPASATDDAAAIEAITTQQTTLQGERTALDQRLGALQEELRQDDQRRQSQVAIAAQIEAAEREYRRWQRLSALIGSASGIVFARFAQGLTLERLVAVANRHLVQLNPRYAIRRSEGAIDDLELEIIDHYQADVTRPMRSLSGGESFLASLALAVGLSELASGRTAIESLFIDEGFGSLDPATLETAMAALDGLQTNGKTIGVISHVDAMKERIATQIHVRKHEGGRSTLEVVS